MEKGNYTQGCDRCPLVAGGVREVLRARGRRGRHCRHRRWGWRRERIVGQLRPRRYHGGRGRGGEQDVLPESDVDQMGGRYGVLVGR